MSFSDAFTTTWEFINKGGFFMFILLICSLAAATVIIYKLMTLARSRVLPLPLEKKVESLQQMIDEGKIAEVKGILKDGNSALARLCHIVVQRAGHSRAELEEAVQSSAREEIVRMSSGLAVLEVITTIAPLLGLLGTASGLITVFGDLESEEAIQRGIAIALSTTVVGIAIAVPTVIAHSFFSRRIETFSARMEVLLGRVVSICLGDQK